MKRRYLKMAVIIIAALFAGIGGIAIPTLLHPGEGAEASVVQNPKDHVNQASPLADDQSDQYAEQSANASRVYPDSHFSSEKMYNTQEDTEVDSEDIESEIASITVAETINQDWIEERIQLYRDQIADEDLEDFRYIIGKLDMNYVNEIIEGRHGSDIDPILKEYLHSKLTSPEYSRARDLFYAYNHLLF